MTRESEFLLIQERLWSGYLVTQQCSGQSYLITKGLNVLNITDLSIHLTMVKLVNLCIFIHN